MDRKHDLDTDEICSEIVSDESKITPRLRAEFVGIIVTLEGIKSRIYARFIHNNSSSTIYINASRRNTANTLLD